MFSVKKFSEMTGVSEHTLRHWDRTGKLIAFRTLGNQRRYTKEHYNKVMQIKNSNNKINIGYARVSSKKQSDDLDRQIKLLD